MAPEISAFGRLIEIKDPEPEKSAITGAVSSVSSFFSRKGKNKPVETAGRRAGVMSKKTLGGILDSLRQAMKVTS